MHHSLYQINLQKHFGGGEVYTQFLCQGMDSLNIDYTILVSSKAVFWQKLSFKKNKCKPIDHSIDALLSALGEAPKTVLNHASLSKSWQKAIKAKGHRLLAIAHMPMYGRDPLTYQNYDGVIGVSQYVIDSLIDANVENVYPIPWYGVASLVRDQAKKHPNIVSTSCYDWDLRKVRDRSLSLLEPAYEPFRKKNVWYKKPGLTIGIVSRLTPIKQFPLMFQHLAPALKQVPDLNIEIFGNGGYASVRDLKKALEPIADNVRFWGFQKNITQIYSDLDFLLTGLPEKEALGLNIIEAQVCNLPVLAVNAPPFTETVLHGKTGFLFTDPREDQGKSLANILIQLQQGQLATPVPKEQKAHLSKFSLPEFSNRVAATQDWLFSK